MSVEDILVRVIDAVSQTFDVPASEVSQDTSADDLDGWDSLSHATLVFQLERIFAVDLPPNKASAAQNLGDLAQLIADVRQSGLPRTKLDTVFVGSDGQYLFHRDHDTVEQITGELQITPAELKSWVHCIETRHAWCAARGITYVHMVVPEKHVVYDDRLPAAIRVSQDRPVNRIYQAVTRPARSSLLYPLGLLKSKRAYRETYPPNDSHWTMYGGFLAYQELMQAAQRSVAVRTVTEDEIRYVARNYLGDLGARMTPEVLAQVEFVEHVHGWPMQIVHENKIFGRGNITVYQGPDRAAPRAMMFRDSFANYIVPHMIPVFSRLTVVASPYILYDLIEAEKPDVVFFEITERFLAYRSAPNGGKYLPEDLDCIDTADFIGIAPSELAKLG